MIKFKIGQYIRLYSDHYSQFSHNGCVGKIIEEASGNYYVDFIYHADNCYRKKDLLTTISVFHSVEFIKDIKVYKLLYV